VSVSAPHIAMIFDHTAVALMGARILALLIGSTEYAPGENTPLIVPLIGMLVLFVGSGYVVYRTIRWLFGPTVPDDEYARRPPLLTHRCGPPRGGRMGTRWACPVCGCPWIVVREGTRMVPYTVEVGPGPPGTRRLETRHRQASGGVYWNFDRATYNA
jgi:hypothetical protein